MNCVECGHTCAQPQEVGAIVAALLSARENSRLARTGTCTHVDNELLDRVIAALHSRPSGENEAARLREALQRAEQEIMADKCGRVWTCLPVIRAAIAALHSRPSGERDGFHRSDCASNNAPALPSGPCDCGGLALLEKNARRYEWLRQPQERKFFIYDNEKLDALIDAAIAAQGKEKL